MAARKAIPINRPDIVLLLQPWSTAISQTKKSTIAPEARTFVHIEHSSRTPSHPTDPPKRTLVTPCRDTRLPGKRSNAVILSAVGRQPNAGEGPRQPGATAEPIELFGHGLESLRRVTCVVTGTDSRVRKVTHHSFFEARHNRQIFPHTVGTARHRITPVEIKPMNATPKRNVFARLSIPAGNCLQAGGILAAGFALRLSQSAHAPALAVAATVSAWVLLYFFAHGIAHWLVGRLLGIRFLFYTVGGTGNPEG